MPQREGHNAALARWIKSGPSDQDGLLGWILGTWLWWRTWATLILGSIPLLAGLTFLIRGGDAYLAVWITWGAGVLTAKYALDVTPRYNVEENYGR